MYQYTTPNTDSILSVFGTLQCNHGQAETSTIRESEIQKIRDWLLPIPMNGQARAE